MITFQNGKFSISSQYTLLIYSCNWYHGFYSVIFLELPECKKKLGMCTSLNEPWWKLDTRFTRWTTFILQCIIALFYRECAVIQSELDVIHGICVCARIAVCNNTFAVNIFYGTISIVQQTHVSLWIQSIESEFKIKRIRWHKFPFGSRMKVENGEFLLKYHQNLTDTNNWWIENWFLLFKNI